MNSKLDFPIQNQLEKLEQFPLASRAQRFMNMVFDCIFIGIFTLIFTNLLHLLIEKNNGFRLLYIIHKQGLENGVRDLILYATLFIYFTFLEALCGRTLGKFITGTKVVKINGEKLSFIQALGRTLCRFVGCEYVSFFGDKGRPRGWHDRISKTKVVSLNR